MPGKKKTANEGKRLYLVDASSYAFRAYHATARQALSNSKGHPTGATLTFTNMLLKLIREEKPTHLVVVWDSKGKTFRHEMYDLYKANRAETPPDLGPQIADMIGISRAFSLPSLQVEGFEADDIIGTLARRATEEGVETVIVSGDKDLTQLVSPMVTMLDTLKDVRYDEEAVKEKWGVEPGRVIEVMGLMGDSSDNVPGVPKVGEKTARKLIEEFGTLEATLARADEVKGKVGENLKEYADQARLSRELVTIDVNMDLDFNWDDFVPGEPDREELASIFTELEFTRLMSEFGEQKQKIDVDNYETIKDLVRLKEFLESARKAGKLAVDTETTSIEAASADLVGVSMAVEPGRAVYVPLAHEGDGSEGQLEWDKVRDVLAPVLGGMEVEKIGQNLKYDYQVFKRAGLELGRIGFDTMVASYVLNPRRRVHNLDELASERLGHRTVKYEDLCGKGKSQIPFALVPVKDATRYAGEDADVTLRLYLGFEPELKDEPRWVFENVEMPLVPVLARMESAGVKVNAGRLAQMSAKFDRKIKDLRSRVLEMADADFNLDSPKQLSEVLFNKMGLPAGKKTKTGYSTNEEVLTKLAEEHEIASLVLEYRGLTKLKSTYTDALAKLINPVTGRIHTSYNQTVTSTGRLSSSDPNLQNIPVRQGEGKLIREAFVGEGDNLIMAADYSQIELRIMAHISEEPALLESFEKGEDIHLRTASEIFGARPEDVTADMRRHAKVINFGILYGMSAHGLTRQLDVDHKEAQAYIDAYFGRYPLVRKYMDDVVEKARSQGYVTTIKGRRLPLPEIDSRNAMVRAAAEREAINAPLQGSAADIIKLAMIDVDRAMLEDGYKSKMIMQVHDELVFEVVPSELDALREMVIEKMEKAVELKVALKVDVAHGGSWAEAH